MSINIAAMVGQWKPSKSASQVGRSRFREWSYRQPRCDRCRRRETDGECLEITGIHARARERDSYLLDRMQFASHGQYLVQAASYRTNHVHLSFDNHDRR